MYLTFNRFELELQARGGRIRELEEELRVVKADLQQEKEEKVDLVTEKVSGVEVGWWKLIELLLGERRGGVGSQGRG